MLQRLRVLGARGFGSPRCWRHLVLRYVFIVCANTDRNKRGTCYAVNTQATTQAIFQGLYMGFGHGVGGLTGGFVYSAAGASPTCFPLTFPTHLHAGLQAVFWVATVVVAGSWAAIGAVEAWRGRRKGWTAVPAVDLDVEM